MSSEVTLKVWHRWNRRFPNFETSAELQFSSSIMELSIESELLGKFKNVFSFPFKVKAYEELRKEDLLEIYSFFLALYDASWVVSPDKPNKALKQIQVYVKIFSFFVVKNKRSPNFSYFFHSRRFLHRMDVGHLTRGEDFLDIKKNSRLLGAIVSKLESRYNGVQNLLAAVRKVNFLPKSISLNKLVTEYLNCR